MKLSETVVTTVLARLYTLRPLQPNSQLLPPWDRKVREQKVPNSLDKVETKERNKGENRERYTFWFVQPKLLIILRTAEASSSGQLQPLTRSCQGSLRVTRSSPCWTLVGAEEQSRRVQRRILFHIPALHKHLVSTSEETTTALLRKYLRSDQ